ncbi:hypothetical protein SAMN05421779_104179 [Insolitispirillum peregrinum]|uniref:Uncharacterized protein n=1 Tax=Insolitispirillum peregrinum TaxID=80876 RepID=A0A1N7MKJ0_9PROT|nr:hypothetical protein SAMN05421779_104179 [Insolitispirillum peregrinum]
MIFLFCVVYCDLMQARWSRILFCRIAYAKIGSHFSHNAGFFMPHCLCENRFPLFAQRRFLHAALFM